MAADAGTGSRWLVALALYFIGYFLIVYAVASTMDAYDTPSNMNYSSGLSQTAIAHCGNPRQHTQTYLFNDAEADLGCDMISDLKACPSIYNCYIENTTSFLWFFSREVPAYCANMNTGSNVGVSPVWLYNNVLPAEIVGSDWGYLVNMSAGTTSGDDEVSLASTPRVIHNQTLCYTLGFTWYPAGQITTDGMSWFEFIGILAGTNTDLGLPQPWAFVFALVFTYIPFLMLILVVRMLLPW